MYVNGRIIFTKSTGKLEKAYSPITNTVLQLELSGVHAMRCVYAIVDSTKMDNFLRLWWYCAMALLW